MIKVTKLDKTDKYVYDISLDGTVVNALGLNIAKQTDGFNFKLPTDEYKIEPVFTDFVIPNKNGNNDTFDSTDKLCIRLEDNTIIHLSIDDIVNNKITENYYVLIENEWVNKSDIEISEKK